MKGCRDESEIYNHQQIQLLNNKVINGILAGGGGGGVCLTRLDCKTPVYTKHILISPAIALFQL